MSIGQNKKKTKFLLTKLFISGMLQVLILFLIFNGFSGFRRKWRLPLSAHVMMAVLLLHPRLIQQTPLIQPWSPNIKDSVKAVLYW